MKTQLSQVQDQRLQQVLAPQLRQSLECLQAPVLELQQLIQHEIEQNPTLEQRPAEHTPLEIESGTSDNDHNEKDTDYQEDYETLAVLDEEWRDCFRQNRGYSKADTEQAGKRHQFMLDSLTESESLQEHLLRQLQLSDLDHEAMRIGEMIIGNINEDGYLSSSLAEMQSTTGISIERCEEVLAVIQGFHPVGVGGRDLAECLKLQLERLGHEEDDTFALIDGHLERLAAHKYAEIARDLKIPLERVHRLAHLIATLDPKPGRMFSPEFTTYVIPEASIEKRDDGVYAVVMHKEHIPRLRISRLYKNMLHDGETGEEAKEYVRRKINGGALLIKAIYQRQQTLEKICNLILEVQIGFMEHGVSHLKPLGMADIAERLGIHETTVSRAIANKYIETPQGVYEMKYFFTPGYRTAAGEMVSNKTVKDIVEQLVADEDISHPLSDQQIAEEMKKRGYKIARRTIAKYREELGILPSHQRRS